MQVVPTFGGTCTANRGLQEGYSATFSRSDGRLQRFAANVAANPVLSCPRDAYAQFVRLQT